MSAMDRVLSVLFKVMGVLTMLIPTNTPNHPPSTVHATSLRRFGKVNWQLSLWSSIWFKGMCYDVSL